VYANQFCRFLYLNPKIQSFCTDMVSHVLEGSWVVCWNFFSNKFKGCRHDNLATHLCPCGYLGSDRCRCTPDMVRRYRDRISGPLLDRIDLQVQVQAVPSRDLVSGVRGGECSAAVRQRVIAARRRQQQRQGVVNGQLDARQVKRHCTLNTAQQAFMAAAIERLHLSARAFHRVLKVARTIADLAGADGIETAHLGEALGYRFSRE